MIPVPPSLLMKLLSPIMRIDNRAAVTWTHDHFTVQAWYLHIMGSLRLKSSCFLNHTCDKPTRRWIDLRHLSNQLSAHADDESLTLSFLITSTFNEQTSIYFLFKHHGNFSFTSATLRPVARQNVYNVDESEFEYEVVVGIPSEEFRRIIRRFDKSMESCDVEAYVTDGQVIFRAGPKFEDIILTTQGGGCVIWGTYYRVILPICMLCCAESFIEASEYCTMVWLLHSEGDSPNMVNIPIGEIGNFMFFPDNWCGAEETHDWKKFWVCDMA
ncbi:uncharacterized protein LOC130782940 [Actinidia eriantha]|uniref:uncharacterized protein LOC130782940 n=1 Tax=Actinidia eriantha TaxID=165200 RepID=UPI00258982FE|nr:uncharacterized protein LOC130782940 [Actinidia eriantha]